MDPSRLGWLTLAWFEGFGARTLRKLQARFAHDGERALHVTREELGSMNVAEQLTDRFIEWRTQVDSDMLSRRLDAEQIRFVLPTDTEFPPLLAASSDPPGALFIRGAILDLKQPVAIVGTRTITSYGSRVTREMSQTLAVAGCEIISGLALGIDAAAHDAALSVGGKTVAVLGGGCNDAAIYPRSNMRLASRILEHGGTIVTETPPGTESFRYLFPLRNRIIASLSLATIVVEAAESSGSLITAMQAIEENRDVFSVPGPITSEQSTGTNRLLTLGAIPCTGADVVLERLGAQPAAADPPALPDELGADEKQLLALLATPHHIDDIVRTLEIPAHEISARVMTLSLNGLVAEETPDVYARTSRAKRYMN